jgi:hypothetical protein
VDIPSDHRRRVPAVLAGRPARARDRRTIHLRPRIANLYPLSLALTLAAAPGNGDTANARTQLLIGVFGTASPYLLGSLADRAGLHTAFTIEPALIGICALLLLSGLRLAQRPASGFKPVGVQEAKTAPIPH